MFKTPNVVEKLQEITPSPNSYQPKISKKKTDRKFASCFKSQVKRKSIFGSDGLISPGAAKYKIKTQFRKTNLKFNKMVLSPSFMMKIVKKRPKVFRDTL